MTYEVLDGPTGEETSEVERHNNRGLRRIVRGYRTFFEWDWRNGAAEYQAGYILALLKHGGPDAVQGCTTTKGVIDFSNSNLKVLKEKWKGRG